MPEKKRYLIGYKDSTIIPQDLGEEMESFAVRERGVQLVRQLNTGQRVVEMTPEQALQCAEDRPDWIVEEDFDLEMFFPMPGLTPRVPSEGEIPLNVKVVDEKSKAPIKEATVYCVGADVTYKGVTDKEGVAVVSVFESQISSIIISPKDSYWSQVIPSPKVKKNATINVRIKKIPVTGGYDWGHLLLSANKISGRFTGRGVKVAIIDSGIGKHKDLVTAGGYNTLDGQDPKAWNVDEKGHGTHCSGIIAAQDNKMGVTGMAPEAEIYSLKVFPGGRASDLIEAINWCIENKMDVLNMSLGSKAPLVHIEQVLSDANARGLTCIAAAGNHGGEVSYPAAYDTVIAVSAIGKLDAFPEESAHSLKIGDLFGYDGKLFFPKFSNFGPQIDICSPGVAILSTIPSGFASWDGTSMACPLVTGLAALILEAYPEIRTGDGWQPYYVRKIIRDSATDIGLPPEMQGAGLPNAEIALGSASSQREYEDEQQAYYRQYLESLLYDAKNYTREIEESLEKLGAA